MASQSPNTIQYIRGMVGKASDSTPSRHNDRASDAGSFSPTPWSVTKASTRASSVHTLSPGLGVHNPSPFPADNVLRDMFHFPRRHIRPGGVMWEPPSSPCVPQSIKKHNVSQLGSRVHTTHLVNKFELCNAREFEDPRLFGNVGDISPSSDQSIRQTSIGTVRPDTHVCENRADTSFGFKQVSKDPAPFKKTVGRSFSVYQDPPASPIYYQPMSTLMSTESPDQSEPRVFGSIKSTNLPISSVDHLAESMKHFGLNNTVTKLSNAEAGPVARIQRNFSPYYQGDIYLPANQSENIPDHLNCSLFIVNLPPTLTTHELLAAIHKLGPMGRVFAVHINDPELQRGHPGCAAKVVFFRREVAQKFFTHCEMHGFRVNDYNARVMWNRIKTSEKSHLANSDASRVLLIGGPPSIVNASTLTDFFHTKLEFQIDSIITHVQGSVGVEDAVIEYRFGSFRCQAQAAKMALARELPHIRCFFGKDPLEPEAYRPFEYFNFTNSL